MKKISTKTHTTNNDTARLIGELVAMRGKKTALVVGDIMLDRSTDGVANRVSPEAPVPILESLYEAHAVGGAGNVAHNIVMLGGCAILVGVVGDDHEGDAVLRILREGGVSTSGVLVDASRPTTLKHRFGADGKQMLRVDRESREKLDDVLRARIIAAFEKELVHADVLVFSDYAKGVFTAELAAEMIARARERGIPIVTDFKPMNADYFVGVDVVMPNQKEAFQTSGLTDIPKAMALIEERLNTRIILTQGEEGMSLLENGECVTVRGRRVPVYDVTGAGDTVLAVVALALTHGASLVETTRIANIAGSIVVTKRGTATVTLDELAAVAGGGVQTARAVQKVDKVWGSEHWLENNEKYCCKILTLTKGYQCSLHHHKVKDEMFLVTKGVVRLEVGEDVHILRSGDFIRIHPGTLHRFRGIEEATIVEVSTTHDDADSFRLEESCKVEETSRAV